MFDDIVVELAFQCKSLFTQQSCYAIKEPVDSDAPKALRFRPQGHSPEAEDTKHLVAPPAERLEREQTIFGLSSIEEDESGEPLREHGAFDEIAESLATGRCSSPLGHACPKRRASIVQLNVKTCEFEGYVRTHKMKRHI